MDSTRHDETEASPSPTTESIRASFQKELNLHGYGFQFGVLKRAQDLAGKGSDWAFNVSEFPVQVQGIGTKIDFILFRQSYGNWRAEMICECKRANPALSNWCFIRAPYIHRNHASSSSPLVLESVAIKDGNVRVYAKSGNQVRSSYHIALAVKSPLKGDSQPVSSRSQIEDAASQVLRGVNGYIEMLVLNQQLFKEQQDFTLKLLPVIFTTAKLWASETDLSNATLETGNIVLSEATFERVTWLWFQYHVSPGIKHLQPQIEKPVRVEHLMEAEYMRSIAIVSPEGIADFLGNTTDFL